jgi:membrane-associated phospholipid phosphatase
VPRLPAAPSSTASGLNAADHLLLGYLAAVWLASLWLHNPLLYQGAATGLAATIVIIAYLGTRSLFIRIVHDFDPIVVILVCFSLAGRLAAELNPARWDERLAGIDHRWFGPVDAAWRVTLGRPAWLTDLASVAYVSFYVLPLVIGIALYHRRDRPGFDAFVCSMVSTFVLSWIGYALVPAAGPRVPFGTAELVLGGGAISRGVRSFLRVAELSRLNAFPSGHAALSVVYLVVGSRHFPRWRVPLALLAAFTIFATVYLSHHYVVDVIAGIALGATLSAIHGRDLTSSARVAVSWMRSAPSSRPDHPRT